MAAELQRKQIEVSQQSLDRDLYVEDEGWNGSAEMEVAEYRERVGGRGKRSEQMLGLPTAVSLRWISSYIFLLLFDNFNLEKKYTFNFNLLIFYRFQLKIIF